MVYELLKYRIVPQIVRGRHDYADLIADLHYFYMQGYLEWKEMILLFKFTALIYGRLQYE